MSNSVLATGIALARIHGIHFAASYLHDNEVSLDVALELLIHLVKRELECQIPSNPVVDKFPSDID